MSSDDVSKAPKTGPRIILVEDDAVLRDEILGPGLRDAGLDVTAVGSAAQLYECLRRGPFDIVVLDVGLPDVDGVEVLRHLRSISSVGVVLLTGRAGAADRLLGLRAGADTYLTKPIEIDVLAATLHSLARRLQSAPISVQTWRLGTGGWHLYSPDGKRIELSGPERAILGCLFVSAGAPVPRTDLIASLTDDADGFDPHRLEMTMHRLRRKVAAASTVAFPLRAVRGKGYLLGITHD